MKSKEALKRIRQETCPCSILPDFDKDECLEIIERDLDKLGQLEGIEEELGCPIELYYKMCIEGTELYSLPHSDVIQWRHQYIYHKDFEGNAVFCLMLNQALTPLYYVKDYGKTWALTREELELL